jgi:thioredoxin 1
MVEPIVEELALEYSGRVKVCKLHVDRNPRTRERYQILGVPTFAVFCNGEIIERKTGSQSKKQLQQMLAHKF